MMFLRIYAKPEALISVSGAPLDYIGKETAPGSRCMRASMGQGARLPSRDVSDVDATKHHILGWNC